MMKREQEYPYCFGKIENVFPMAENGFRTTPESCMPCIYKTECLRAAMQTGDGLQVKQEALKRAYDSGRVGFWERWSQRKTLLREKKIRKARG